MNNLLLLHWLQFSSDLVFLSVIRTTSKVQKKMSETSEASAVRRSWWGDGGGKGRKRSEERGETFGK